MDHAESFELLKSLPHLLGQAAERTEKDFHAQYKDRFGLLRSEWRVLFFLGRFGEMTATEICDQGHLHKTKASRAISALQKRGLVSRHPVPNDRRHAVLDLTSDGKSVFQQLSEMAEDFDKALCQKMPKKDVATLKNCLEILADPTQGDG